MATYRPKPRARSTCLFCGASLDGHRSDAIYCGGRCRAEASRMRRLLSGQSVDGWESVLSRVRSFKAGTREREGE